MKPAREEFETINVGNEEIKRELKIRTLITLKEREKLIAQLREYVDVFLLCPTRRCLVCIGYP